MGKSKTTRQFWLIFSGIVVHSYITPKSQRRKCDQNTKKLKKCLKKARGRLEGNRINAGVVNGEHYLRDGNSCKVKKGDPPLHFQYA